MSQQRARGMVLWGLASFVGLQLGLGAILAWGPWWFLTDPAYGYKAYMLKDRLARADHPYTIVLLGSSRTFWGVNSACLEPPLSAALGRPVIAFNFAQPVAGPANQFLFLRRALKQGMRPDLVVIEITPVFLAGQVSDPVNLSPARLPTSGLWREEIPLIEHYVGASRPDLGWQWLEAWLLPAYGHRLALLNCLAARLVPDYYRQPTFRMLNASGFLLPYSTSDPTPQLKQIATQGAYLGFKQYFTGFRLGGPHTEAVRQLLELCRKEKLAAVLFVSPEGDAFRSWYPPGAWEQVQEHVHSLCREFAVPLIDARNWLTEEEFVDSHHVLPRVIDDYTARLGRQGLLPVLSALGQVKETSDRPSK